MGDSSLNLWQPLYNSIFITVFIYPPLLSIWGVVVFSFYYLVGRHCDPVEQYLVIATLSSFSLSFFIFYRFGQENQKQEIPE